MANQERLDIDALAKDILARLSNVPYGSLPTAIRLLVAAVQTLDKRVTELEKRGDDA